MRWILPEAAMCERGADDGTVLPDVPLDVRAGRVEKRTSGSGDGPVEAATC